MYLFINILILSFCVNQSYHNKVTDAINNLLVPHTSLIVFSCRPGWAEWNATNNFQDNEEM